MSEAPPGRLARSEFLVRAGRIALGGLAAAVLRPSLRGALNQTADDRRVRRWDVITIGNLSRNRFWGEGDDKPVRTAVCTCTLVVTASAGLLVDPSLADADRMAAELDRRAGLKPSGISAVFLTHEHADHLAGLSHFPDARWLAAPAAAEAINRTGRFGRKVEPAESRLWDAIGVVPTPGHTKTHHSLRFDCDGRTVAIAGDAVPTADHFRSRLGLFNSESFETAARTMDGLAAFADIIVPGHDNFFITGRR
jgi:glyoxylase-like metal-dependent hydrolase (beta-lactamase superfamily II)